MDIKFETEDYRFNVRSSCIIKDKSHEKVLLTNMRAITDHSAFLLPGGRLNLMENSQDAIARELDEELGIHLNYKLISIEENIVEKNRFHMIEFVYYAEIENFDNIKTFDNSWDNFQLFDINTIENVDVRPKTMKELITRNDYDGITHNINYDWL